MNGQIALQLGSAHLEIIRQGMMLEQRDARIADLEAQLAERQAQNGAADNDGSE